MSLLINGVRIDDPRRCYVVAELGSCHQHDYATAEALIHAAAKAGAQAVKFQTYDSTDLYAEIPFPFGQNPEQDVLARRLGITSLAEWGGLGGLPRDWHLPLKALAESVGLAFFSTPFSVDAARFLVEEVRVPCLKIASGDLTFEPLLTYAVSTGLPLIVSTGASTLEECDTALFGPLEAAWANDRVVLLHCVSAYPTEPSWTQLRCMQTMREDLDVPVGFSDHTRDTWKAPIIAVACGAVVYEKHLKLAEDTTSPDAGHALTPDEFVAMVATIREAEAILGNGIKEPHASEARERLWGRRSPVDWKRPVAEAR